VSATPYGKSVLESGSCTRFTRALPSFWGRATVIADKAAKISCRPTTIPRTPSQLGKILDSASMT
jgi:putative cardiolipin synthase